MKKVIASAGALFASLILFSDVLLCQEKCEPPTWKVGESWKWKPESSDNLLTGEVLDATGDEFVLRQSDGTYIYDKKTLNQIYTIEGTKKRKTEERLRKMLNFPLFVGKKWTDMIDYVGKRQGMRVTYLIEYRVEGLEDVTTPVGTFKSFRIFAKALFLGGRGDPSTFVVWYSPEAKFWVKRESRKETGVWGPFASVDNAVLIEYSIAKD